MGLTFTKLFQRLWHKREMRILMVRARRGLALARGAIIEAGILCGELAGWRPPRHVRLAKRTDDSVLLYEQRVAWRWVFTPRG
jgi:hypothetical protein